MSWTVGQLDSWTDEKMERMKKMKFGKGYWKTFEQGIQREWVVTNGIGGYAGSTIIGGHTRKHHGMLIASLHPPIQRHLILSKIQENVQIQNGIYDFSTNQQPGWIQEGHHHLQRFTYEQLPEFTYQVEDLFITKTVALVYGTNTAVIGYHVMNGSKATKLTLTPLMNFRDHNERSERADLIFEVNQTESEMTLIPSKNPTVKIRIKTERGTTIESKEKFYSDMQYATEIATGMSAIDNHYIPGAFQTEFAPYEEAKFAVICTIDEYPKDNGWTLINQEKMRIQAVISKADIHDPLADILVAAADQFIVHRKSTNMKTVMAGYPWFADWGRDTMIALQGLTLTTKRYEDAKEILWTFAKYVKNGLVPNMFPDEGAEPLYNTADASMWYFHSVHQFLMHTGTEAEYEFVRREIYPTLKQIIKAYKEGTDFSIKMDEDRLIQAGSGLDQVTWMDVRVGEWVVTPRHGKPVEINALWYNALRVMSLLAQTYGEDTKDYDCLAEQVKQSFCQQFWNEEKECLYDVVSTEEQDDKVRPNQIWAVSLPFTMLPLSQEKKVVEKVCSELYATYGLRSLSPWDEEYRGVYFGQLMDRDGAYHQGTSWGFPLGALITAYCKVNEYSKQSIKMARRMLEPIEDHLRDGCVGSIAEIFDGNEPIISRGCYAQAWSVGEVLRAYVEDILVHETKYNL